MGKPAGPRLDATAVAGSPDGERGDRAIRKRVRGLSLRARRSTWLVVGATIALHALLWPLVFGARLPYGSYFEPVLAFRLFDSPRIVWLLAVHLLWSAVVGRRVGWGDLDPGRRARVLVTGVAVMFAITFATLPYNFYYDQAHLLDRLLLLAVAALVWVHPALVQPFVLLLLAFAHQTSYPLPDASWMWPDKRLPFDLLVLFTSYLYVRSFTRPRRHVFLVLALALTGAVYSFAAVSKMGMGPQLWSWVAENKLSNLLVSSFLTSGWLGPLGEERVVSLAHAVERIDPLLAGVTLGLELAGFAILLRPRLTRLVLVGFVLMHTGILLASGIFFWKWVVTDLLLLVYFDWLRRDSGALEVATGGRFRIDRRLYALPTVALLILVVAGSGLYFYNVPFAWWDTRFANQVRLHAITSSGERLPIDGRFFAPYDVLFVQARFYYLIEPPVLCDTFGTTRSYPLARALAEAEPEDVPRLRREHGRLRYSERWHGVFAGFVHRFVTVAAERGGRGVFLQHLSPPFHFQGTAPPGAASPAEVNAERIEVVWEETLYDGERIVPVVRGRVLAIPLSDSPGAPDAPGGGGGRRRPR